jgi:hypothetical protein
MPTALPVETMFARRRCIVAADDVHTDADRAEIHAAEAEKLLKSTWIWSYIQAQAHATLALYYAAKSRSSGGASMTS